MAFEPLRRVGAALATRARLFAGSENRAALLLLGTAVVLIVVAIAVAAEIAEAVMDQATQRFDEAVLLAIDRAKARLGAWRPLVDGAMLDITALGSIAVLTILTIGASGFLFLSQRRGDALLAFVVPVLAGAINTLLKFYFARPRPSILAPGQVVHSPSFPSGHAMSSMAIYLTLGILLARLAPTWRARLFATAAAVVTSLLVSFSRLYLAVHYPTDVIAGALFGLALALAALTADEVYRRAPVGPGA